MGSSFHCCGIPPLRMELKFLPDHFSPFGQRLGAVVVVLNVEWLLGGGLILGQMVVSHVGMPEGLFHGNSPVRIQHQQPVQQINGIR